MHQRSSSLQPTKPSEAEKSQLYDDYRRVRETNTRALINHMNNSPDGLLVSQTYAAQSPTKHNSAYGMPYDVKSFNGLLHRSPIYPALPRKECSLPPFRTGAG